MNTAGNLSKLFGARANHHDDGSVTLGRSVWAGNQADPSFGNTQSVSIEPVVTTGFKPVV